jgi:hypothetical protein
MRDQDSDGILDCPNYSSRMLQRVCVSCVNGQYNLACMTSLMSTISDHK